VGGYWLLVGLERKNKTELSTLLDMDHYSGSQAFTIKLPLAGTFNSNTENYERVDGEFEFDGTVYRMVKQKFHKDTVYLVCYKDETSSVLKSSMQDYVKSLTDRTADKKSQNKTPGNSIKDYCITFKTHSFENHQCVTVEHVLPYLNAYRQFNFPSIDHPPQLLG
jgi:hypothetical protein